jgi:hypothetical protein
MAKNSITDYSKTASLNTDIQSVDIDEGCLPSGINNAIREIMADLAAVNDGTVSLTSPAFAAASLTGDLSFGDNDKAIFGAGSDLQIYHNGSSSFITDVGTGDLFIRASNSLKLQSADGENYLSAAANAFVRLYYNNSEKLVTSNTGIDVTGTVTADGLTVDGSVNFSGLAPTVDYDFNASGSVTSADSLAYSKMGSGIATAVNISSVDTITPSWSALSGSTYSDNKFRIMSARGNATDALRIATSLTAEGHGDTTIIGNINVDGVNTRIITGLSITGGDVELLSNDSRRVNIAANGDISFYEDTGTTAKLFWDASAERLGLGTTLPNYVLDLQNSLGGILARFKDSESSYNGIIISSDPNAGWVGNSTPLTGEGIYYQNSINAMRVYTNSSEAMRIDSSGRVGIGTSSPDSQLELSKSSSSYYTALKISNTSTSGTSGRLTFENTLAAGTFESGHIRGATNSFGNGGLVFEYNTSGTATGATEAMRIDHSGNLLVGTTTDGGVNGLTLKKYSTGISQISNVSFGGGFAQHTFRYNGTTVGSILTYTNATAYNTSSDYRLKKDFQSMTGVTERVKALNPVNFAWKSDGSRVDGFIAHEAQTVVPEAVTGEKDAVDADGNPEYQGIDQSKLVPLLTAALQEAITKIEDLEARVATLEGN